MRPPTPTLFPYTTLFRSGVGTLLFHLITRGMVPVFLGSSFAFIAPITEATRLFGFAGMLSGIVAVGAVYGLMSALVDRKSTRLNSSHVRISYAVFCLKKK